MAIPFTQYLRPDGRTTPIEIDMPDDIEKEARQLINRGIRFEAEVLTTGMVSLTSRFANADEDTINIQLCRNGPEVLTAVEKLIRTTSERVKDEEV